MNHFGPAEKTGNWSETLTGVLSSGCSTTINKSPNQQYEHCADDSADKAGILIRPIPANGLPEVSCRQRANDAKDRR